MLLNARTQPCNSYDPSELPDAGYQFDEPISMTWFSRLITFITSRIQSLVTYCIAYLAFAFLLLDDAEPQVPAAAAAPASVHARPRVAAPVSHTAPGHPGVHAFNNPWPDTILILVLLGLCFRWTQDRNEDAEKEIKEAVQRLNPSECSVCRSWGYHLCIDHFRGHKDPTIVRHSCCQSICQATRYDGCLCGSVSGSCNTSRTPLAYSLLRSQNIFPVSLSDYSSEQENILNGSSEGSTEDKDSSKSPPGSDQGEIDSDDAWLAAYKLAQLEGEEQERWEEEKWDEVDDQGAEFEQSAHCKIGERKSVKQSGKARKALKLARLPKAQSKRQKKLRDGVFLGRD
jgi:hypothetical protein